MKLNNFFSAFLSMTLLEGVFAQDLGFPFLSHLNSGPLIKGHLWKGALW